MNKKEEVLEEIQLNDKGYSIVKTDEGFKILELTFDYQKGMIGGITVLKTSSDRNEIIERFKIIIANNLM